ncbi:hypothetical protein [Streptomyces triticiradicis]|uniref:Uncharacterized protein n=1 Tax=Streptomyces triticiradicis TaxID=2651189 RepID=A0A7J5D5F5_9ACTN|nr:hypothetical protein [Streptomyces triticiradicis]KAB1979479.1 hypothetical protein F8144_36315 [Streptomyces triticiradicis]
MTVSDGCALPQPRKPSAAEILDTPLPRLLAKTNVELHDSSITDRTFFGAVVERKSGQLLLAMPAGRSEREHDTMARYLLAKAFDVHLPDLPPPFSTVWV